MIRGLSEPIQAVDMYVNCYATNYPGEVAIANRQEAWARTLGLMTCDVAIIDTKPSWELLQERHDTAEQLGRLSASLGGDESGTGLVEADQKLSRIIQAQKRLMINRPLIAFEGLGNGKNIHASLGSLNLGLLLNSGEATVGDLHPLHVTFPGGEQMTSTSIVGHGAIDAVRKALDARRQTWKGSHPTVRFVKEMVVSDWTLGAYDTRFTIASEKLSEILPGIEDMELSGLDALTKTHIAKGGRVPIEQLGDEMFMMTSTLPNNRITRMSRGAWNGLRFSWGRPLGAKLTLKPGEEFSIRITDSTGPVGSQSDGAPAPELVPGDSVRYTRSEFASRVVYKPAHNPYSLSALDKPA